MERIIRKIEPTLTKIPVKKRVAAYARVSSGKDAMLHSLSAQISYYSGYIQKQPGWEYLGVYADEAITGTKDGRKEFQRLLSDCREGKIDLIITKSISRFARNTVTMLETVRELKSLDIDVYFEKENIHSVSGDGELMLSILASFAQEESLSVSENCKWRIRNKFKEGLPYSFSIYGYELRNGQLEINPQEAAVVKLIFEDFLSGMGKNSIIKKLNALGIKTKGGFAWRECAIERILRNEKYVGDLHLQKVYSSDHIQKKKKINKGELPQYYVTESHESIIDRDTFNKTKDELIRRAQKYSPSNTQTKIYNYTAKLMCSQCGKHYKRKINNAGTKYEKVVWICSTYNRLGKDACPGKQIPEEILDVITKEISADFENIKIYPENKIVFILKDGTEIERGWNY